MIVSPLQEIERKVQDRANGIGLDTADEDGRAELRRLIDAALESWSDEHRRGMRDFDLVDHEGLAERAFRNLARYGPLTTLLEDEDVWEIMVNAPDTAFC